RLADRHRARHIGRAVEILCPGIDEIEAVLLEPALACRARMVMDDGAIGAGARNRRKAQIAKELALAAESFEPVGNSDLAQLPRSNVSGQPGEKTCQRRAVAAMRRACAVELDRIFAGLGQLAGIGDAARGRAEPVE